MAQGGGRHDFVVVVPVADRPRQLAACLDSLVALGRRFPYAGRVSVLIADDSRETDSLARHRELAAACGRAGLEAHHLGPAEQLALLDGLPADLRGRLSGVLGERSADAFFHKGAAVTRNLACLWLRRQPVTGRPTLYWFVDSDQVFGAESLGADGEPRAAEIDYLHGLDRLFSERPIQVLTGKVVGDPPVSPAVMAGTCLDDVIAFLAELADLDPAAPCTFHGGRGGAGEEAAYHDMADLFGFRPAAAPWRYRCPLPGPHHHAGCLAAFAAGLDRFFDGEHPTRRSFYRPGDPRAEVQPARTLYTGNYVLTREALAWFIPFAPLRLRMAGPTLGRILRAELGDGFVSANLPMLHRRTVADLGQGECRPGIERGRGGVDLSGEFERQFFGDVLLFAVERLADLGYPAADPAHGTVAAILAETEAGLRGRYLAQRERTLAGLERLRVLLADARPGWWHAGGPQDPQRTLARFGTDLAANFAAAAPVWRLIGDAGHRRDRLSAMAAAIGRYRDERHAWAQALAGGGAA